MRRIQIANESQSAAPLGEHLRVVAAPGPSPVGQHHGNGYAASISLGKTAWKEAFKEDLCAHLQHNPCSLILHR